MMVASDGFALCHYLSLLLSLGLGTTYSSTFWILPLSFSILHYDFCYLCYLQAMRVEPKNEETRTPIDEEPDSMMMMMMRMNERDQIETTQVMKEDPLFTCLPALPCALHLPCIYWGSIYLPALLSFTC
jgi:hypothetical protein